MRRLRAFGLLGLGLLFCASCGRSLLVSPERTDPLPTPAPQELFFDDFSTNQGWTYGPEWQRGPAAPSSGHSYGWGDPAQDHSSGGDNILAGAVIGGNTSVDPHDFYYLTSPAFDTTGYTSLYLSFWRWYNGDYADFAEGVVEVWDGSQWVVIFSTGPWPGVQDAEWTFQSFDLTPYLNGSLQVRFGHKVGSVGCYTMSGWNIDDVKLTGYAPYPPTPTPTRTCVHPVGIVEGGIIPDHTPDPEHPLVFGTPVLVNSAAECHLYSPGSAVCDTTDFGAHSLILNRSVELCNSSWIVSWVEENCLGGLTVYADFYPGCYCCTPPPEYRYTVIPRTTLAISEVVAETP